MKDLNNSRQWYNNNPNLPRSGTIKQFTPHEQAEIAKCIADPVYFAETYFKIVHQDFGLIPFKLFDYQRKALRLIHNNRKLLMAASRQCGKALNINELIPLFGGGFSTIGELQVGDAIIGSDGNPVKVTYKSPIHNKPTYRITFDDKTTLDACEDHQWTVYNRFHKHKKSTLSTRDIVNSKWTHKNARGYSEYAYYIPNIQPVDYSPIDQPIDPYILGAWLGDGSKSGGKFTCHVDEVPFFESQGIQFTASESYERANSNSVWTSAIKGLKLDLRDLNLIDNKHIPHNYLYGSKEQRIALLQGIVDTDGHVKKDSGQVDIQLSTKVPQLLSDLEQLLCSLGFKVTKKHFENDNFKDPAPSIRLSFTPDLNDFSVCRMERKAKFLKKGLKSRRYVKSRTIQNVELIETIPTQCITVDANDHLFAVGKQYQITHNTTFATAIILHTALFNEHKNIAVLANKESTAKEILERVKFAYEHLPDFLKGGVAEWNIKTVKFENGTKIFADATGGSSIRGKSIFMLYIDEMAFVEDWDQFSQAVLPTISSGKTTKMIFTSTPKGLNHFHNYYLNSKKKLTDPEKWNGFEMLEVPWWEVPGRDEKWRVDALGELNGDQQKFDQEYSVEFIGSSGTLISGGVLKTLSSVEPLRTDSGYNLKIYEEPVDLHQYVSIVDTSRGKGLDYSAFQIIDISEMPYRQVCTYRNNLIQVSDYAAIVDQIARFYNDALLLIELNDMGEMVSNELAMEHENENIMMTEAKGRGGRQISAGHGDRVERGVITTKTVKSIGCSMIKSIVEQRKLNVVDEWTISEMNTFSAKGSSYEAEEGKHDDMMMPLVLFGWLTSQDYFKQITDSDIMKSLREMTKDDVEDYMLGFGFVDNGIDPYLYGDDTIVEVSDLDRWLNEV